MIIGGYQSWQLGFLDQNSLQYIHHSVMKCNLNSTMYRIKYTHNTLTKQNGKYILIKQSGKDYRIAGNFGGGGLIYFNLTKFSPPNFYML